MWGGGGGIYRNVTIGLIRTCLFAIKFWDVYKCGSSIAFLCDKNCGYVSGDPDTILCFGLPILILTCRHVGRLSMLSNNAFDVTRAFYLSVGCVIVCTCARLLVVLQCVVLFPALFLSTSKYVVK